MSILIKDMEMPKSCFECKLLDYTDTFKCRFRYESLAREHGINISRPDWCPLVPIPPHGRLGDLDELYVSLKKWLIQNGHSMTEATRVWIRGVLEGITAAPTIIPAEEGET